MNPDKLPTNPDKLPTKSDELFTAQNSLTLSQLQNTIDHWIQTIGVRYYNELTNTAILMEEVGEVARIMARRYGEQSFKDSEKDVDLADEIADVLFVLVCIANQTGINLNDAVSKNLAKKNYPRCSKTCQ